LVPSSERIWSEQEWYALTGRVVDLRAEEDGDLHIALADAGGDKPGIVVVEIPAKAQWCELRKIVFGWTQVQFPFRVRSGRKLKIAQPPIITVIGKASSRCASAIQIVLPLESIAETQPQLHPALSSEIIDTLQPTAGRCINSRMTASTLKFAAQLGCVSGR
jgi:hypothetical protein